MQLPSKNCNFAHGVALFLALHIKPTDCFKMKTIYYFFICVALCLISGCNRHVSGVPAGQENVPDSIAPFLGLSYGMGTDANGNYVDSILDTIPGLIKFEKSAMWCDPEDSIKYDAAMGLYVDSVFPTRQIEGQLLTLADSLLRVEESDKSLWDSMPRFNAYADSATVNSFLNFWSNLYDKVSISKAPPMNSAFQPVLDFRWCTVIHKIYEDDEVATYLVGESWDVHGSCGNPSWSSYLTFDKQTGAQLMVSDVVRQFKKGEVENLLLQRYSASAKEKGYEPTDITGESLITEADGVARIGNLYLFFYHPYKIGDGAEGQFNLFIPRKKS